MADELNERSLADAMVAIDQHYKDIGAPCPNATDPSLVERIARAMCKADGNDPDKKYSVQVVEGAPLVGIAAGARPIREDLLRPVWKMYAYLADAAIAEMFDALKDTAEMNAAYPLVQVELQGVDDDPEWVKKARAARGPIPMTHDVLASVSKLASEMMKQDGSFWINIDDNSAIAAADEAIADSLPSPKDSVLAEAIRRAKEKDSF